jgi:hypothetical protein
MLMRNTVLLAAFQHTSVVVNSQCASALKRKESYCSAVNQAWFATEDDALF